VSLNIEEVSGFRFVALICALLVPSAVVADDLIRAVLSGRAMTCCASMEGDCAGVRTPDSCCQTRKQAAGPGLTTTAPSVRDNVLPCIAVDLPPIVFSSIDDQTPRVDSGGRDLFKRPHDPPHLHVFHLLI
jgi:hypothetical protein